MGDVILYDDNQTPLWPRIRHRLREPFAEFIGTFILIIFGTGVVAQTVLSAGTSGDSLGIHFAWGIGVMFGVYASGGVSGGHLNPAVTLAACIFRGFPWKKLPVYMFSQTFGAFCAALVIYGNYKSAIDAFEGVGVRTVTGPTATAGIFCTYPQQFLSTTGQFFSEFIATAILEFGILAINDEKNLPAGNLAPIILLFLILGIGASLGWETGYAINFARDFGPRVASTAVGYPAGEVWGVGYHYFWVPMIAPFIGAVFGAFLYDFLVYTGEDSPINWPYMGLDRLLEPGKIFSSAPRGSADNSMDFIPPFENTEETKNRERAHT
ncbi:aquaporin [Nadsonia fulvescens var. elongata DSM 6958]|uniref:Aquaporin n=1 Tax=Nadsonia fulvescens var. elongata DSM 6958 TaxID=857566 RepID=A0A1E3PK59_9ASCO|nr:aquaporin [Nadsonia fulvescens var. elongata DSM 6958]